MKDKKPTILVVDDTAENLKMLSGVLKEKYRVKVTLKGAEALEIISKERPDLILLDIMMPEMDGYEVCSKLKEDPGTKDIPIIFLTAKTEVNDIVKGFELGAVDYVPKPFNTVELLVRIDTHLRMAFLQRELFKANEELEQRVLEKTTQVINFEKIINVDVDESFIISLKEHEKSWLMTAIQGMIKADKRMDEKEIAYLKKILTFLGNKSDAEKLIQMIRSKEPAELKGIRVSQETTFSILVILLKIAFSDGEISASETGFFGEAAKAIGIDSALIKHMLNWANKQLDANSEFYKVRKKFMATELGYWSGPHFSSGVNINPQSSDSK